MTYGILKYLLPRKISGETYLMIPCEIVAKSVIPAIKALMAKQLIEKHGLKQEEAAKILGITQSAVSKYARKVRGYVIKIDDISEIEPLIDEMLSLLLSRTQRRAEFLKFFCQTCITIRRKGLMCPFCQKADKNIKIEECNFCLT